MSGYRLIEFAVDIHFQRGNEIFDDRLLGLYHFFVARFGSFRLGNFSVTGFRLFGGDFALLGVGRFSLFRLLGLRHFAVACFGSLRLGNFTRSLFRLVRAYRFVLFGSDVAVVIVYRDNFGYRLVRLERDGYFLGELMKRRGDIELTVEISDISVFNIVIAIAL